MKAVVSNWVWIRKSELRPVQLAKIKADLTITPRVYGDFSDEPPEPIYLYTETRDKIGVAREYFLSNRRQSHNLEFDLSEGSLGLPWPMKFDGTLRPEQQAALMHLVDRFKNGTLGGLVLAPPGWGKTVFSCALIAALQLPTLITVHKEFLMDQWLERIKKFIPNAKVGIAQQDRCEYIGNHIVLGMVHTLANRQFSDAFLKWPGLYMVDECHRIGAHTWSPTPSRFYSKLRVGLTATARRKDGAEKVFWYQLGPVLFDAKEVRLKPKIRRVYTTFRVVKTSNFNPAMAPKAILVRFLIHSTARNIAIAEQLMLAVKAGRKVLVLSERLKHLDLIQKIVSERWSIKDGSIPSFGRYVGGRSKAQLEKASRATIVLATTQYAQEGLDIPALDTLFLVTPLSDVEQAVGRILRPSDGKKDPVVVDFRDDDVPMFKGMAKYRDAIYKKLCRG